MKDLKAHLILSVIGQEKSLDAGKTLRPEHRDCADGTLLRSPTLRDNPDNRVGPKLRKVGNT
jgi:hypothetical protein